MRPIHLFGITSQHNQWLASRQSVIAGNIANANTPNFKARDITPFSEVLSATTLDMAATKRGHLLPVDQAGTGPGDLKRAPSWDVVHSGNSVSMEKELMKSSGVNTAYSVNTGVLKAFQRMLASSSRSA
jgi:flagellar basal-body rod protein FlgB